MRAAAGWAIPAGVGLVALLAATAGFQVASFALAGLLLLVAAARWLWRREEPEALAVRAWPVDVAVTVALAASIAVLAAMLPA